MTPSRLILGLTLALFATSARADELADQLRALNANVIVLGKARTPPLASMLGRDADAGLRLANRADAKAWQNMQKRADWEAFRDARIKALRDSLGTFPPPAALKPRVTGTHAGDGYHVDNIVYETRPGLIVTANLYRPTKPAASMPGIIVVLSHQRPRYDGQRQDIAMTWAREGCVVLVPDHLGHGERRQHPFGTDADSYPHDYHFRYDLGIQLHLVGESLMGWLAYDLMRGVDVLLAHPGVDARRIIMISEPAGGGDVAAVTAALDPRITGVMVHNFGGPEPEDAYPLARDAEDSFNYTGSGSWESTRNLYRSARDGFLPWTIVASIAPRKLIYYHEFYWDEERDPVWRRLRYVYAKYKAPPSDRVGLAGRGFVVGSAPENTHWTPQSRALLYPVLQRWFAIPRPETEYNKRRPIDELLCMPPKVQPLHVIAARLAAERIAGARKTLAEAPDRRARLRASWTKLLGDVEPAPDTIVADLPVVVEQIGAVRIHRIHLTTEPGIVVPVLLLVAPGRKDADRPGVVIGVCQEGKQEFLRRNADAISLLLQAGVSVCLPDVRGTGETAPPGGRDRTSPATSIASTGLMLGVPMLGRRLRDLRAVIRHLRNRTDVDGKRLALWGDSFAPPNALNVDLQVPYAAEKRPGVSEPLGGLLALLGGLYEDDVRAIYGHRGLSDFASVVEGRFRYVPYDVVVPGVLTTGDLADVAAALAPRYVRLDGLVDGQNRAVARIRVVEKYQPAVVAHEKTMTLTLHDEPADAQAIARWLTAALRR